MDADVLELHDWRSNSPVAGTASPIPGGSGVPLAPGERTLKSGS